MEIVLNRYYSFIAMRKVLDQSEKLVLNFCYFNDQLYLSGVMMITLGMVDIRQRKIIKYIVTIFGYSQRVSLAEQVL